MLLASCLSRSVFHLPVVPCFWYSCCSVCNDFPSEYNISRLGFVHLLLYSAFIHRFVFTLLFFRSYKMFWFYFVLCCVDIMIITCIIITCNIISLFSLLFLHLAICFKVCCSIELLWLYGLYRYYHITSFDGLFSSLLKQFFIPVDFCSIVFCFPWIIFKMNTKRDLATPITIPNDWCNTHRTYNPITKSIDDISLWV